MDSAEEVEAAKLVQARVPRCRPHCQRSRCTPLPLRKVLEALAVNLAKYYMAKLLPGASFMASAPFS